MRQSCPMNKLSVRRILESESDSLRQLRLCALKTEPQAFLSNWEREAEFSPARWQELCHRASHSDEMAIFICQGPDPHWLGMAGVHQKDVSRAEVWGVFLDPHHRGQGLGQALLSQAIDWARERGWEELVLEVNPDLKAAVGLYSRLGFQPTGETRNCCGGKPALGFKLRLQPLQEQGP